MDVKEAWRVWITHVGKGGQLSSDDDGLQLEEARRIFYPGRVTPEHWQAVADGSLSDLAAVLKGVLQDELHHLRQPSSTRQQLPGGENLTSTTLSYLNFLLGWRARQQSAGAQDWCSERWRPVVDLLLTWAPQFFEQCLDHLNLAAPKAAQPPHTGRNPVPTGFLEERPLVSAGEHCLSMLVKLLTAGAGTWTRPHSVLDALSAWLRVAVAWGRRCDTLKECYGLAGPAGRFGVLHFLPLLVAALCGEDRGFRKAVWPERVAQLLAKDRKLAVALVKQAVLPALEDMHLNHMSVLGQAGIWALQVLGCFELQPALVQAVIDNAEFRSRLLHNTAYGAMVLNQACFWVFHSSRIGDGSDEREKLTALRQGVQTAQVYWQYSVLLLRLQQGLVSQGLDDQAEEVQRACYPVLSTAHEGLATTVKALLAACDPEESNGSAPADWQPGSQPEQQLLWELAVACRGALENLLHVLTVERYSELPAAYHEPCYAARQRASGDVGHLIPTLRAAGFCLSAGLHPLWRSLWAALYATAQQEPCLQVEHGLQGQESAAAEQAAEERALLALQYHLQRLAKQPVCHEALHRVLLNLVSIQKDVLLKLAKSGYSNLSMRSSSLDLHLGILTALMPSVCQPAALFCKPTMEGCMGRSQPLHADHRQLQGAAFQAMYSLTTICGGIARLDQITYGCDRAAHERLVAQGVQRVRDALLVTQQAAAIGAKHYLAYASLVPLISGIFERLAGSLTKAPAWTATLLPHAESLLGHLAGCMSPPAMALCVVLGGFGPVLAAFLVNLLGAVKEATTEQSALSASVQRLQKLGCQLVRTCCQAVDEQAGTDLRAVEQQIEDGGNVTFRKLLLEEGLSARAAAVDTALRAWLVRLHESLHELTVVARAAHVGSLLGNFLTPEAPTGSPSNDAVRAASSVAAVQRELAVSAVLACARPLCEGRAAAFNRGTRLRLCAGCRGVRYCSEECAKQDWARHRPCCKALQGLSRV